MGRGDRQGRATTGGHDLNPEQEFPTQRVAHPGDAPAAPPTNKAVETFSFPGERPVMDEWWEGMDPEQVAKMPDTALPPAAIEWLKELGLR